MRYLNRSSEYWSPAPVGNDEAERARNEYWVRRLPSLLPRMPGSLREFFELSPHLTGCRIVDVEQEAGGPAALRFEAAPAVAWTLRLYGLGTPLDPAPLLGRHLEAFVVEEGPWPGTWALDVWLEEGELSVEIEDASLEEHRARILQRHECPRGGAEVIGIAPGKPVLERG